ncbi:MAG: DUF484 family protein [Gammaproteobacteria bacterium]|nr:DUF484 family protein [Gammaproteobacteria bacterium]MDH5618959.1 DUF484 family protein [Gammaproteobacteria bacterium]
MSTQRKAEFVEDGLSEQSVHDFLAAHPDFFERHSALLSSLDLPHASGGAVSLVERQVAVLRQKELRLERQLKELIQVARQNDVLSSKVHELTLQLLGAASLHRTIVVVEEALRSGFGADQAVLVLFGDPDAFADINVGRFFRVVRKDDETLKPFSTFLNGSGARCGKIRDSQREFLFRHDADEIGSAALVPLGDGAELGFLAVGSVDSDRFHPGMSIDFLTRLGDLVAGSLKRF